MAHTMSQTNEDVDVDAESARPNIRAKVWARQPIALQDLGAQFGEGHDGHAMVLELPKVPVGDHLWIAPALDRPDLIASVPREQFETWGMSLDEALQLAVANLERVTTACQPIEDGVWVFSQGDSYDAARLLLTERIRALPVRGRHLAMAASRDLLVIADSQSEIGLGAILAFADQVKDQSYSLPPVPLVLEGDRWIDWKPPVDDRFHILFLSLESSWLGPIYAEQAELLNRLHERDGIDIHVAEYSGLEIEDDLVISYCIWGEGVDTLLPKAQKVLLMRPDADDQTDVVAETSFERLQAVVGDLMEPTDHDPPRWRVRSFPDDAILDELADPAR